MSKVLYGNLRQTCQILYFYSMKYMGAEKIRNNRNSIVRLRGSAAQLILLLIVERFLNMLFDVFWLFSRRKTLYWLTIFSYKKFSEVPFNFFP